MPNGKLHKKPPKRLSNYKKATKLEQGLTVARLKDEDQFKNTKKGFIREIKNHIGKAIDRIDPFESAAVLGMTVIVKKLIDTTEELRAPLKVMREGKTVAIISRAWAGYAPFGYTTAPIEEYEGMFPDWMDWLISFTLAYIIVKHAGQLIGLLGQGMVPVVKLLMGVMA